MNEPSIDVGDELFEKIKYEVEVLTNEFTTFDTGNINLFQAEFQADSVLAYRSVRCLNDIVFSSDTDQSALVGSECCC